MNNFLFNNIMSRTTNNIKLKKVINERFPKKNECFPLNDEDYISSGVDGEVFFMNINDRELVVKKAYSNNDALFLHPFKNFFWNQIIIHEALNKLLDESITPHFPYFYSYSICNTCIPSPKSKRLQFNKKGKCLMIAIEKADGDLFKWLKPRRSDLEIKVMFAQIILGLIAAQKYIYLIHRDLHFGNILYKKIPKTKGYFKYLLDDKTIYLPNIGYIFYISDVGRSLSYKYPILNNTLFIGMLNKKTNQRDGLRLHNNATLLGLTDMSYKDINNYIMSNEDSVADIKMFSSLFTVSFFRYSLKQFIKNINSIETVYNS